MGMGSSSLESLLCSLVQRIICGIWAEFDDFRLQFLRWLQNSLFREIGDLPQPETREKEYAESLKQLIAQIAGSLELHPKVWIAL